MDRLWELSGVSPANFFSLADLLTLTNDGQYDPNLLAAVFSREKGASHVTAAAMREERVKVGRKGVTIVYVARNDGFQDVDRIFKDQLQNMLRLLAKGEAHKRDCHRLWKLMCSHYKARLNSYISDLRRLLDQAHYPPGFKVSEDPASQVLNSVLCGAELSLSSIVKKSYLSLSGRLRKDHTQRIIRTHAPNVAVKICDILWSLARLRKAYLTFIEVVKDLPGFQYVEIVLLPVLRSSWLRNPPVSLTEALDRLSLSGEQRATQEALLKGLSDQFQYRQERKRHVHAEVQLVVTILAEGFQASDFTSQYIGCSKQCCVLCAFVLSKLKFCAQSCHGRVYSGWTIPCPPGQLDTAAEPLSSTIRSIYGNMEILLKTSRNHSYPFMKHSVLGSYPNTASQTSSSAESQDSDERHEKTSSELNFDQGMPMSPLPGAHTPKSQATVFTQSPGLVDARSFDSKRTSSGKNRLFTPKSSKSISEEGSVHASDTDRPSDPSSREEFPNHQETPPKSDLNNEGSDFALSASLSGTGVAESGVMERGLCFIRGLSHRPKKTSPQESDMPSRPTSIYNGSQCIGPTIETLCLTDVMSGRGSTSDTVSSFSDWQPNDMQYIKEIQREMQGVWDALFNLERKLHNDVSGLELRYLALTS